MQMCTNLRVKAKDGSVVIARTMEFALELESKLLVFPRNMNFASRAPGGEPGVSYKSEFGFVGVNGLGVPMVSDGMNEKGLYFGALYLPGFTKYQEVPAGKEIMALAPIDVGMFLLATSGTVSEAIENIKRVLVWAEVTDKVNITFPLHFSVQDKSGAAAVFEYIEGNLNIHENKLGVLTNSPPFDWHLINLRNFVNLSPDNALGKHLSEGVDVTQIGEGSGMLGLPGDPTPPSRFVRAVALTQTAFPSTDSKEATLSAVHIINNFDLVKGLSRSDEKGQVASDYTQWSTIADLSGLNFYIRMQALPMFAGISLKEMDFGGSEIRTIDPNTSDWFRALNV